MSEERLNYYREWIEENEEIVVDSSIFEELVDGIDRLQDRIDKAIEYIENRNTYYYENGKEIVHQGTINSIDLLNILKGE